MILHFEYHSKEMKISVFLFLFVKKDEINLPLLLAVSKTILIASISRQHNQNSNKWPNYLFY
jgi:hypothetical protein